MTQSHDQYSNRVLWSVCNSNVISLTYFFYELFTSTPWSLSHSLELMSPLYVPFKLNSCISLFQAYSHDAYLRGNNPYAGKAQNLPPPPPVLYPPRTKTQPPVEYPPSPAPASSYMGQNQLDNWSRWPGSSSGPSPPLDNRTVASNAVWAAEGRSCEPGGVGHSSPAHRTEEIQYGMTDRGQQATGQMRGRTYSSSSSSGGMMSPLHHAHLANHNVGHIRGRKESPIWTSPSQSTSTPPSSHSERTQQALSNWYYSQVPGREREQERERSNSRSMHPRHRSFSQDRLGEIGRARRAQQAGFPHSASQDTLLLLQQSTAAYADPHWNHGDWRGEHAYGQHPSAVAYGHKSSENLLTSRYGHSGRSLEALDRAVGILPPRLERSTWVQQPPNRTEIYLRRGGHFESHHQHTPQHINLTHAVHQHSTQTPQPQQAAPQARRLPSCQSLDEEPIGYRSYSPSFNRKTGRILQQAQSFRDPTYTGPHLWTPTTKTSPPEGLPHSASPSPAPPTTSSSTAIPTPLEGQDRTYRPTNHDRGAGEATGEAQTQEVVLRQKPPTGRRGANALRHPHYGIALDSSDPLLYTSDSTEPPAKVEGAISHRRTNGNLPPLSLEDDSLASIPFIGKPYCLSCSPFLLCVFRIPFHLVPGFSLFLSSHHLLALSSTYVVILTRKLIKYPDTIKIDWWEWLENDCLNNSQPPWSYPSFPMSGEPVCMSVH